jgi:protein-tyrosine phosphatase
MGNICRSPMAERLLAHAVRDRLGDRAEEFVLSESAGTGGWHAGEAMNAPAAKELRSRGALDTGFHARKLMGAHVDTADLILTATAEQLDYVAGLRADALDRAFVLGEFGRLVGRVDTTALPPLDEPPAGDASGQPDGFGLRPTPAGVHKRGVALVRAVNAVRSGAAPESGDDLDDPWGRSEVFFTRTADEIAESIDQLVDALLPKAGP